MSGPSYYGLGQDEERDEGCTGRLYQKEDQEKAYDQTLNKVSEHEVVEGKIIALDKRQAIVDIGYKSDGVIPISDFRYNPDVKVGDVVEVEIGETVSKYKVLEIKKTK